MTKKLCEKNCDSFTSNVNITSNQNANFNNSKILFLFTIITCCFPKAGIATFSLPITAAMILFLLLIIVNIRNFINKSVELSYMCIYIHIIINSIITILLNKNNVSAMNIAYIMVLLSSPLTYIFGGAFELNTSKKILSISLIIVGGFSLLQFIFGVNETAIPGLTIAIGEDYTKKQIFRSGIGISKIPSTYQNGTLLAPFLIISIAFLLQGKDKTKLTYIALFFGLVSLLLSGSRSSLFSVIMILPILIFNILKNVYGQKIKKILIIIFLSPIIIIILFFTLKIIFPDFASQIYNSYVGFTLNDSTLSGRTTQWSDFLLIIKDLNIKELIRFLLFGLSWDNGKHIEGLLLFMKLYGVTSFFAYLCFLISFFIRFRKLSYISYSLIVLMIIFMIDGSVFYPPTLMNVFLILGMSICYLKQGESSI